MYIYIYNMCLFIYFYTMIYRMMYTSRSWEPDLPSSKQLRPPSARVACVVSCIAMALAPAFSVISPGATPTVTTLAQEASTVRRNVTGGSSGAGWDVGGDWVLMGFSDFFSMDMFDHLLALGWGSSGFQWVPVAFWVKHVGVWHCLTMTNWFQTGSQTGLSPRCRCHRGWFGSLCCREPRGNPKPPSKGASDGGQRQCNGVPWIHSLP